MPDRTPAFWIALWDALPDSVKGGMLSFFVAFFRVFYDGTEPRKIKRVLDAVLCGLVTFGVAKGINAIGMHTDFTPFLGGVIGLFGVDWVRAKADKYTEEKLK